MICPRCGYENIDGADRCEDCLEPFRDRDVPQPTEGLQRAIMQENASTIATTAPLIVTSDTTVAEAVRKMKQNRTGCVLVVSEGLLIGIFTERDLLMKLAGSDSDLSSVRMREVMTSAPETVEATDSLRFALNKMSVGGFRHIPITAEGRVLGLVTAKDALRFLAREVLYKQAE
jgi:CBS domain-containing protein